MRALLRSLLVLSVLSTPLTAQAVETQAVISERVRKILQHQFSGTDAATIQTATTWTKVYATAAELLATTPTDGTIGYAIDTDVTYFRQAGNWVSTATLAALANGATWTNAVNGTTTLTEGGETEQHVVTNNLITLTSDSGATYAVTPAIAFTADATFSGAAGAATFDAASSAVLLSGSADNQAAGLDIGSTDATSTLRIISTNAAEGIAVTGTATVSSTLGVTGLTTATGGLYTTKPLFAYDKIRFCGNGSNGAAAWYIGPVLESDTATDFSVGSAACDGNDSATEGTADRPMDAVTTIKVVGMMCATQAGGADDVNTFQLRSAVGDVAGVTCTVTNDGAAAKTCSVVLTAPVAVAVGATLAVKNTQVDDDMSAKDVGCVAYYTY